VASKVKHIIHKQTIDIRFADFNSAHSWDAAKQAETVEALRTCIEICLEDYDFTKDYLTIDKLELDLGVFSTDQLMNKMPERFHRELQKILSSYHANPNDFTAGKMAKDVSPTNIWSATIADSTNVRPIVKNSEVTAFLFFLQHGYLPWWYSNEPAWNREWIKELTEENWIELLNFLTVHQETEVHNEPALTRLVSQFNDEFLSVLLKGLKVKEPVDKARNWIKNFHQAFKKSLLSFNVTRQLFWEKWIRYALGKSAVPELETFFVLVKEPLLITDILSEIKGNSAWLSSVPEFWRKELISLTRGEHVPEINVSNDSIGNAKCEKFKKSDKASEDKEDFILIPDAGLVLLHPFLPRFFEYCTWIKENDFLSDEARYRAVNALHYLSAGDEEVPEYVLMLPKLLCGLSLEWPLEMVSPLTDEERAACEELLVQVIGHWSVLRNSSPVALRETFLRRQGKLFLTDKGCRLEVQRKTEDILVDRLPWGFSMIKYSWMPQILSVSWE
jgi:hypothetical protein